VSAAPRNPWFSLAFITVAVVGIYAILASAELAWLAVKAKVVAWAVLS
jgi:hypothetical protein